MANEIQQLLKDIKDERVRARLSAAVAELRKTKKFGLVFEEHLPELLPIYSAKVRAQARVAHRDGKLTETFIVQKIAKGVATVTPEAGGGPQEFPAAELVVVKRFGEAIFPALRRVASVLRGGDAPHHTLIEADNYHALQLLEWLYAGKVDCIYIDPPYNSGARDWKYNNDYVDGSDSWRHSKWLAMMQRRLKLAKRLLNPKDSVLIVTIDEKEYLRLGMLLEQMFPEGRIQMVSVSINPAAVARAGYFGRSDEYYFFVMIGQCGVRPSELSDEWITTKGRTHKGDIRWDLLRKSGSSPTRDGHPETFYPFFVSADGKSFHSVGEPIGVGADRFDTKAPKGTIAVWPIRKNGTEGRWRLKPSTVRKVLASGGLRIGDFKGETTPIYYLAEGERAKVDKGIYQVLGHREDGSIITSALEITGRVTVPGTQWRIASHDATQYGTRLLLSFLPHRRFPFPKSLYAVEDALRFFVKDKVNAVVLDFFAGSGTTAHAVLRLNRQDGGRRQCISVTNNEVAVNEQDALREQGLRPGDAEWERIGICRYITMPRLSSAMTGKTPEGEPVIGDYKFNDEFAMAEGFAANLDCFQLDFLDRSMVETGGKLADILPALWMMAGCRGKLPTCKGNEKILFFKDCPFAVLVDESAIKPFLAKLEERSDVDWAFLVTNDQDSFSRMCEWLPEHIPAAQRVHLWRNYVDNFLINVDHSSTGDAP